jgi:predicted RNase H-like HicB family nuclease
MKKISFYHAFSRKFDNSMNIKAVIHPAEEGGYWAEVPALPGCITEGDTIDEVMANLKDAIEGWLDVANERQMAQSTDQIVEIAV